MDLEFVHGCLFGGAVGFVLGIFATLQVMGVLC